MPCSGLPFLHRHEELPWPAALPYLNRIRRRMTQRTRNTINGLLFAAPWLFGLSHVLDLPDHRLGLLQLHQVQRRPDAAVDRVGELPELFTNDPNFWDAVYNTFYFAIVSIPLAVICSFGLAMMLNAKVRGQVVYRTIYFLPTLVPEVALALVWVYIFTPITGLISVPFNWLGIRGPCWLTCEQWARPTLVLLALWIIGQQIVLYLAGLQDVPQDYYDASDVDGAGFWHKFRHITVPSVTPVIFFHVVTSVIGAFQFFAVPYIMTGGTGFPANSTLFYSIYLYKTGFQYFEMGYASALAWLLFLTTLVITLVIFRSSRLWVFYAGGDQG